MFAKRTARKGFTLIEIIFAVAIMSVSLIGISSIISMSGNQATRMEDEREASELAISLKNCVASFWIPYLRTLADGRKTETWFWSGNDSCLTGNTFTGIQNSATASKIGLRTQTANGSGTALREYWANFETSTAGVGPDSVKGSVTVTNGTVEKKLEFRLDGSGH